MAESRYSREAIDQALRLYLDDVPLAEIRRRIGCSPAQLGRWIQRAGLKRDRLWRQRGKPKTRSTNIPDWQKRRALHMYQADKPIQEIVETVGCSTKALYLWLEAAGVPRDRLVS